MMDTRVPDEIEVQHVLQVEASGILPEPRVGLFAVNGLENDTRILLFLVVACNQSAVAFRNLESRLQAHRPFRKGANEGLKCELGAVPLFVAGVIRVDTAHSVTGDQRSVQLDQQVISEIADFQLLAQWGL